MAEEQIQENTVVNQGTTIDNLPGLDGMTPAQKQAFIDSAFVPIRGTISGEMATRKVTGSDLAASGENRIDSISLNNVTLQPDDNKNVNIQVASVATTGSYNDLSGKPTDVSSFTNDAGYISESKLGDALKMADGKLCVGYDDDTIMYNSESNALEVKYDPNTMNADYDGLTVSNPLPVGDEDSYNQMLICYNDTKPVWASLGGGLIRPSHNNQYMNVIEAYIGDGLTFDVSGAIAITHPIPNPTDEDKPAAAGDVLTYDGDDIVWAAPAAGNGLPEPPEFPANVSGGEVYTLAICVEEQAPDTYVWSDPYWKRY